LRAARARQGVVSTCNNEASLRTSLFDGGLVIFSCSGVVTLSSTIIISIDTTIDGTGQLVTLSGGGSTQVIRFPVAGVKLGLTNLTISGGQQQRSRRRSLRDCAERLPFRRAQLSGGLIRDECSG
jgi:hypothetical protein